MTQPDPDLADALAYEQAQIAEYDQYRAASPVRTSSGVLVYDKGHPIPASNVDSEGRIVMARHICVDHDPCDRVNQPIAWSGEGMAESTETGKRRQSARKAAETRAANKDSLTETGTTEKKG